MESRRTGPALATAAVIVGLLAVPLGLFVPAIALLASVPLVVGLLTITRGQRTLGVPLTALGMLTTLAGLVLLVGFRPFKIPSESMAPTIGLGDRVLVQRALTPSPEVGDLIVLHPPEAATSGAANVCGEVPAEGAACARPVAEDSEASFVERVVARGGDRVAVVDGRVVLNGEPQAEPYIREQCGAGTPADFPTPISVPEGHLFVLGDNRQCSEDSRFWGPVRESAVVGLVRLRTFPLGSFGPL